MKKLHFNSTLNHKASDYKPCEICVERVVTLYGRSFEELKNHLMHDDPYIVAYRDLMYTEGDTAHCLLFVDYDSGDGVLVESEGSNYARKSQFIPNARALLESNEMTAAETRLHNDLKKIADKVAELAHCGEISLAFDELLAESDLDVKSVLRDAVTAMLREREDIQMAESQSIEVPFQPDITVEAKPTQKLSENRKNLITNGTRKLQRKILRKFRLHMPKAVWMRSTILFGIAKNRMKNTVD